MSIFDEKIMEICKGMGGVIDKLKNRDTWKQIKDLQKDDINFGGVYVFWENGKPIYVGRGKNIDTRKKTHRISNIDTSSFASHLIREKVAENAENIKYMISSATITDSNDKRIKIGTTKSEIKEYIDKEGRENFKKKMRKEVRERIKGMYFTRIKEENPLQQALIEIFCMKLFGTITTGKKLEDNIDKKKYKYKKYNFSY